MADSQYPFDHTELSVNALTTNLSSSRIATYLSATGGDKEWAFEMYLYNSRLAKSLLYPINVSEVVLRNAVDQVLVKEHGDRWHECAILLDNVLNDKSKAALDNALSRVGRVSRSKVVAALTFDFWSNLFRDEYHEIWRSNVTIAFPHCPQGLSRDDVQSLVKDINVIRNRVAHHEPLLRFDVNAYYSKMQKLVSYRCPKTLDWMKHHSTVSAAVRTKPKKNGVKNTVDARADPKFQIVHPDQSLLEVIQERRGMCLSAYVCVDPDNSARSFTASQFAEFISQKSISQDGIVDLGDYAVSALLEDDTLAGSCATVVTGTSMVEVVSVFQKNAKIKSITITDEKGDPVGVIARSHRRY